MRPQLQLTNEGKTALIGITAVSLTHFLCGSSFDTNNEEIQDESPFQFNIAFQKSYIKGQQYQKDGVTVTEGYNHVKVMGYLSASNITFDETGVYTVREIALLGTVNNQEVVIAYGYDEDGITFYEGNEERQIIKLDIICEDTPNITINNSTAYVNYGDFLDHKNGILTSNSPVHGLTYQNNRLLINGSPLTIDVEGVSNAVFDNVVGVNSEIEVLPSASNYTLGHIIRDKATGLMYKCVDNNGTNTWQTLQAINPRFENIENNISALQNSVFPQWNANQTYNIGDIVSTPNLSFFQYMEALSSGTSGATLTISDTSTGKSVLDNNIIWLICDSRDGRQVGEIALSPLYSSISSNENIWSSTIINNGYLLLGNGGNLLTNQDNGQKIINPQNWFTNYSFIRLIKASINTVLRNFDVQLNAGTNEYNPSFTQKFFDFSISASSLQYRAENPFTAKEISAGGFIILNSLCKYPTTLTSELLTEDGLDWGWNSDFSQMTSARRMEVAEELFTLMTTDDSNEQYPTYIGMYYSIGTTNERYIRMTMDTNIALDMEAGLPNISATVGYLRSQGMNETTINGYLNNDSALKWKTKRTDSKEENLSTTSNDSMADLILDASKSNSIYGKNWTVTPQNISFNTYIKL